MELKNLTGEELLKAALELEDKNLEQKLIIEEQQATIQQLNIVIGTAKAATVIDFNKKETAAVVIPVDAFEYKGKNYKWKRAAFRLPGDVKKYTAAEAVVNEDVMDRLISIEGQSALEELA